jgi:2,3-bisphosphoglycerate-independent phosphoglycerate mutase
MKQKVFMIIMDGWGIAKPSTGNAISLTKTPNYDLLKNMSKYTELICSGESVGLPEGQMGNSEVGHLNLGAGRIVYQDLTRITKSIKDGNFFSNPVLLEALSKAKNSSLHLMGLLSDGGIHSDIGHLKALINAANDAGVRNIFIDAFLDGRDTEPKIAYKFIEEIKVFTDDYKKAKFSTIGGRYFGMDRDKRWDRVKKAYDSIVSGKGKIFNDPSEAIESAYSSGETDEFVTPSVILNDNINSSLKDDDVIIFFNFRADRAREITKSLTEKEFPFFEREDFPLINYYCFTQYDEEFDLPVLFPKDNLINTVGEVISKNNMSQLRIAETEKYAHVTFFFNGGREEAFPGEERILIPSPKVPTYDLKPEMSANKITDEVIKLKSKNYDFILLNYANLDMIGHTGNINATITAVQTVDKCVGRIYDNFHKNYDLIITADHGNAEQMTDNQGNIHTAHTTNLVPFLYISKDPHKINLLNGCYLRDAADLILNILNIQKPDEMKESRIIS